jgi:hypothetical protein
MKAQQHERPPQEHDRAPVVVVLDADQAERAARQKPPVGAREALEVHRRPQLRQRRRRQRHVGRLDRSHGAGGVHRRVLLGIDDHGSRERRRAPERTAPDQPDRPRQGEDQDADAGHRHTVPAAAAGPRRAAAQEAGGGSRT